MIRLVAIDMDGTLLRPDGHISERNVRALKGLKAMGAEFLICTGRSYIDALEPLQEAGLRAPVVCMNGALCMIGTAGSWTRYGFLRDR